MKLYIYTAEVDVVAVKHDCLKFLKIFSQKYEVRILIFFKTFKDIDLVLSELVKINKTEF